MFGEGGFNCILLIGHPEHDLLFIATQVARVAGLKNPSSRVTQYRIASNGAPGLHQWRGVEQAYRQTIDPRGHIPGAPGSAVVQANSWLATESWVYKMLLAGRAPASEPFRKWVTEEVLPSIRKTGSYDIGTSKTPEAQQLSMDYGDLRALIENMAI